ncbi:MAG TPA: DUF1611 domain-containing protein [Euryarchaeota archaeon]|nr:hypothetical protein BMS3Bbin15_01214 [archaeon BMS3Bbin15]HDL14973.1 DUF1611 domain-containing protein [Euryarchaeota archaeon]
MKAKAIVYCEKEFGKMDGKTANGLVRHSEKYEIACVIDSTKAGMDAGEYLDGVKNGIPIFHDFDDAVERLKEIPNYFIYGVAPLDAFLKEEQRKILLEAMEKGMNIVNGLHEFFTDDEEFTQKAEECGVKIYDVRKPLAKKELHIFSGRILKVNIPIVAVLGTDSAVGKRTTSIILVEALRKVGLNVAFVATGQTGLIQGAKYGVAVDAIVEEFMTGEIENAVMKAYDTEHPDIIIVEGQGAISHPAYLSPCAIVRGAKPKAIIVQHSPKRKNLGDFPYIPMPTLKSEIEMIEIFSRSEVIAITINHEDMTDEEIKEVITEYEKMFQLLTTDVLKYGCEKLVKGIFKAFPELPKNSD